MQQHSEGLESAGVQIRLLFVLHDGHPNDAADAKKLCMALRGKVEVIGVLLDPDDSTRKAMRGIFGEDRLVACAVQGTADEARRDVAISSRRLTPMGLLAFCRSPNPIVKVSLGPALDAV